MEGQLAGTVERTARGDADEDALLRPACECRAHRRILVRGEQQRERRRAVLEIGTRHLARLDRVARAVEHVVGDLERDTEEASVLAAPAAEHARGLEELPSLERAALEVVVDRRVRIVALAPLHRFATGESKGGIGEHNDSRRIARLREHGEGAREEVVPGCLGHLLAVLAPSGGAAAPHGSAVDEVVVDERRHVHELDRDTCGDRTLCIRRRGEERECRSEAFPPCGQSSRPDLGDETGMALDGASELRLDLAEILVQAGSCANHLERSHGLVPTCSATIPPPRSR